MVVSLQFLMQDSLITIETIKDSKSLFSKHNYFTSIFTFLSAVFLPQAQRLGTGEEVASLTRC